MKPVVDEERLDLAIQCLERKIAKHSQRLSDAIKDPSTTTEQLKEISKLYIEGHIQLAYFQSSL